MNWRRLLRWQRTGRRVKTTRAGYDCTVRGCDRLADPWDGPFCPDHTWADHRKAEEEYFDSRAEIEGR